MKSSLSSCYCGSQLSYAECCEPYILGEENPPTAEKLMRSRYSAFATVNPAYLLATAHPVLRRQQNETDIRTWASENKWQKLEVIATKSGLKEDQEGEVEFKAYYTNTKGLPEIHHERSVFIKEDGSWLYLSGITPAKIQKKIQNRNDMCACGSGKKYKNCCGR